MKRHLTGFSLSALLHVGVALALVPLLVTSLPKPPPTPSAMKLSLSQFKPMPEPVVKTASPNPAPPPLEPIKPITPVRPTPPKITKVQAKPEPVLKPKPVEKPKPEPKKQPEKPKVEPKKLVEKAPTPSKPTPKKAVERTVNRMPAPIRDVIPRRQAESAPIEPVVSTAPVQPHPQPTPVNRPTPSQSVAAPVNRPTPPRPVAAPVNRPPPPRPAPVPVTRPATVASNPGAEAAYRSRLQALIAARKQYPRMAEKEEAEGVVSVAFVVLPNGTITGARIARSAGNQWLDQAALQAVRAASGALPFPADIHKRQWSFTINVNFALE